MKLVSAISSVLIATLSVSAVNAHFLWIALVPDATGKVIPHLCFGEGPAPGEEYLLDNVAQSKAWVQRLDKSVSSLKLTKSAEKEVGSWAATEDAKNAVVFAICDYGVLEKGGKTFLLQYYAKHIDAKPELLKTLGRTEQLPLDIVPSLEQKQVGLTVLWQGKPAEGSEVVVATPDDKTEKFTTDAEGRVTFKASGAGVYAIRAKLVVEKAGEREGKAYPTQSHYSTLTLKLPGDGGSTDGVAPSK